MLRGGALITACALVACASTALCAAPADAPPADVIKAVAVLLPTSGNSASGLVTFTKEGTKVRVVADVSGLAPSSRHGFHIHEFGDTTAPDASSAGGHFNPAGHQHGGPTSAVRHPGDFGNLTSDLQGNAHLDLLASGITLSAGMNCILGRGVIVHEKEDDLTTQPTGNAGARIAAGVIGVAKDGIRKAEQASAGASGSKVAVYTCPHHTDLRIEKPGKCPRCGMELVRVNKP